MTGDLTQMVAAVAAVAFVVVVVVMVAVALWTAERAMRWQDRVRYRRWLAELEGERDQYLASAEYWRSIAEHPTHRPRRRRCRVGERA